MAGTRNLVALYCIRLSIYAYVYAKNEVANRQVRKVEYYVLMIPIAHAVHAS